MRQIRETLHLHLQAGLSYSEVGRALKISTSAVGTLAEAREVVALCAYARRPDLADEYIGDLRGLRVRLTNDRAAADEALHVDTTPRVTLPKRSLGNAFH